MANKLRRLLGRNLCYTQMNEQLDAAINQLQNNTSPEARMQLNALKSHLLKIKKIYLKYFDYIGAITIVSLTLSVIFALNFRNIESIIYIIGIHLSISIAGVSQDNLYFIG